MEFIAFVIIFLLIIGFVRLIRQNRSLDVAIKTKQRKPRLVEYTQEEIIHVLRVTYETLPHKIKISKANHDLTKLNIKQQYLVISFYYQYFKAKNNKKDSPILLFTSNHVGESYKFEVSSKEQIATILNQIFNLKKHPRTYLRIYSKSNKS